MIIKAPRIFVKNAGGRKTINTPRGLPLPIIGNILSLIFAGLSVLDVLFGAAATVAKTVIDAKNSKKKLVEVKCQ